jgi:hypothetical protein
MWSVEGSKQAGVDCVGREGTTHAHRSPYSIVPEDSGVPTGSGGASSSVIDEIVREGARRMLAEALRAEVDAYCAQFADLRDENGYRPVVRNGLYLHGLSSGDFAAALGQFLGSTKGLSAETITKMTETWQVEQKALAAWTCRTWTTCMCGPTAFTSTCAWTSRNCARWC